MSVIRGKVLNNREVASSGFTLGGWSRVVREEEGQLHAVEAGSTIEDRGSLQEFLESASEPSTQVEGNSSAPTRIP